MVKKIHRDNPGWKNVNPGSKIEFPKQNAIFQNLSERILKILRAQIDPSRRDLHIRFFRGF